MSVEALGTDLLREVKVEGLNEVERIFYFRYSDRVLTLLPSFYTHYKSSSLTRLLPLLFHSSINSLMSSGTLVQLDSNCTTKVNGRLSKKVQLLC